MLISFIYTFQLLQINCNFFENEVFFCVIIRITYFLKRSSKLFNKIKINIYFFIEYFMFSRLYRNDCWVTMNLLTLLLQNINKIVNKFTNVEWRIINLIFKYCFLKVLHWFFVVIFLFISLIVCSFNLSKT